MQNLNIGYHFFMTPEMTLIDDPIKKVMVERELTEDIIELTENSHKSH